MSGLRAQLAHTLNVTWQSIGGELLDSFSATCPYEPDEYDKPCRVWASEDDETGESEDGCWVQLCLDEGIECVSVNIPTHSVAPWAVYVAGSGDEGPRLIDVSLDQAIEVES